MKITFLGHAGFCVETAESIVVIDPWLSPAGAFDAAWFQFPRNHHLAAYVQEKLSDRRKARYVYISHEHKDHYDRAFLDSIRSRDFTFVLPAFRHNVLGNALASYESQGSIVCADRSEIPIPDGSLTLFLEDSELNRDSAILVKAEGTSFLNLNDCKLFDALPQIVREEGPVDVFTCQFSGASWHPTCYEYERDEYEVVARRKIGAKFHAVAGAIETLRPRVYIPSAGPPCFLDPTLIHLNFEPVNIFPRAPTLVAYLDQRLAHLSTTWPQMMPGDVLDAASGTIEYEAKPRVDEAMFESYVREYAASYEPLFAERNRHHGEQDVHEVLDRLQEELGRKLSMLSLADRVPVHLYFQLTDAPGKAIHVDFRGRTVDRTARIDEPNFYSVSAPSWQIRRLLDGALGWEDFSLTFRMRLNRSPDVFQTIINGFLRLEAEDMNWFCSQILTLEERHERIVKEAGGKRYAVDRYCPHQGGDLAQGWVQSGRYLTCPRHGWQFDLERGGESPNNAGTINAMCLDDD